MTRFVLSSDSLLQPPTWPWPFNRSELTAGLRRYFADTSLQVVDAQPATLVNRRPSVGRIRGVMVEYQGKEGMGHLRLVLKEPLGATRTGLAGVGRREVGFYRSLSGQIPMASPKLVAHSPLGDWLLLEYLSAKRQPQRWTAPDYLTAVEALADLHNRFWGLNEDLEAFPWLGDPLASDFEVHLSAAAKAIEQIAEAARPEPLAGFPGRRWLLETLARQAEQVVDPLRNEPGTLLHGDYWPGNIALLRDGTHSVFDWQLTGTGPGVLDLLVFINKSDWWFGPLPLDQTELIDAYRARMEERGGIAWNDMRWELLWDHALMWRFVQEWLDLLAAIPLPVLATRAEQLNLVWLQPLEDAVARRLSLAP